MTASIRYPQGSELPNAVITCEGDMTAGDLALLKDGAAWAGPELTGNADGTVTIVWTTADLGAEPVGTSRLTIVQTIAGKDRLFVGWLDIF